MKIKDHREDTAVGAERLYFFVADRADGDDRHVEGVERRHALDQNVADGAEGDQDDDGAESEEKPASGHLSERGALHFTRDPSAPNHTGPAPTNHVCGCQPWRASSQ